YIDNGMIQGKQYALPLIVGNPRILLCNMEILGKSGFDTPPQTWDELVECTTKIAAEQPDVYAFPMGWGEPSVGALNNLFYPFLWQAGGDIFDESGKLALDSAEAVKAAQFIYDLRYKHKVVSESCTSLTDGQLKDAFVNGKAATYITGSGIANMLKDAPFEWDYTTSLRDKTTGTFAASDSLVLLDSCKNKELATKLMKYITSAPTMESLHTKLRSGPPLTKDAKYCDLEKYERMYAKDTGSFHTLPVASGMPKVYDTLYKNLQLMMLDELTPEQALKDTVDYAETVLEQ
ncbi:MAG: extracellular solute-binding protein, partial [Ruthenibacterium sp.]